LPAGRGFPFLEIPRVRPTRTSGSRYDAQIQQDVDKALRGKPLYNRIKATTEDQVVTLWATPICIDKGNLTHRVEKIKDAEAVRNHVQVESSVPDDQLWHTLADRLRSDRVGFGIAFNAISLTVLNGVATLHGVVHNDPDKNIAGIRAQQVSGVFNPDNQLLALNQDNQ